MDLGLAGRVALVTGASAGLGRAMAIALAREGVKVAVVARREDALKATCDKIRAIGGEALSLVGDLSERQSLPGLVAQVQAALGEPEILINNTGGPKPSTAAGADLEAWRRDFDQMVLSVMALTDLVLPAMRRRGWGRIVTSTSSGVIAPIANLAPSNALRLALVGWSKTLAREVAAEGVTVNVIVPGRIATERIQFLDAQRATREGRTPEAVTAESVASIPAGRFGDPEEYAAVAAFLCSAPASYVTGTVVRVDGGMLAGI